MRNRLKTCLLAVFVAVLCLLAFPTSAQAASISDLTFQLNADGKSYYVADCRTYATGDLLIPAIYNGKRVTRIGNNAFEYCTSLTSITIPDSVTSIGYDAFRNCSSLTGITIPDSVTYIGSSAFSGCSSLTSITIPDSVTSIGGSAFSGCSGLKSMTIPFVGDTIRTGADSVQYPFGYIFGTASYSGGVATSQNPYGDTSTTYYIPASLKSVTVTGGNILDEAFYNCSSLTSITIPDSVTSIGYDAFSGCSSLTSITIPDSVTSIGAYAFDGCSSLKSITIPDSVTSIGYDAFRNCSSLTSITIPDSVTYIGSSAFSGCSSLTSITIPDSMTSIGDYVFYDCYSLISITIPDSVTSIGYGAFLGCSNLQEIDVPDANPAYSTDSSGVLFDKNKTTLIQAPGGISGSYVIPDSVTSLGSYAFRDCTKLTSITIPDSITSISGYAFSGCSSLTSITIPDSVTYIGSSAFSGCRSLESITIPFVGGSRKTASDTYQSPFGHIFGTDNYIGSVSTVQSYFGSSTSTTTLNTYYIPASLKTVTVTGGDILFGAFYNCSSLTKITILEGVTSIGSSAFSGCSSLTSITIPDSVTSIGRDVFLYCSNLNAVCLTDIAAWCNISFNDLHSNPLFYGKNLYLNGELVTNLVIPDGVTSISRYAFYNCSSLTSITIPDSVTSIGDDAFYGCSSLTSITIPNSVTSLGSYAFYNCSSLTSITIPDSVTSIGSSAFSGCSKLETMTIPFVGDKIRTGADSVQYPFGYIFGTASYSGGVATSQNPYGYTSTTYYIPASLKSVTVTGGNILDEAFYNCRNLEHITIGAGISSIGSEAFAGCDGLRSVVLPNSVTQIGYDAFYYCTNLTSVTLGSKLEHIGYDEFSYCTKLKTVYFRGTEAERYDIFYSSSNIIKKPKWHYNVKDVSINGNPAIQCGCCGKKFYPEGTEPLFADVHIASWQFSAVNYALENNLMAGKGKDANGSIIFDPNSPISREEFVQVLYNAENKPSVTIANRFPDVAAGGWYKNAVLWANQAGIASGMGDGRFGVGKNITRQDLALMLYKYAAMKNLDLTAPAGEIDQYADGSHVSGYAQTAMNWAVKKGVLSGKGVAGKPLSTFNLDPAGTATRAECAAMLKNFMEAFGL